MNLPDIHCKDELLDDLIHRGLSRDIINAWFRDRYSTSKHLLTLSSIAIGLSSKVIVEVGFGRSTFALLLAADLLKAKFICCDRYDYTGYLDIIKAKVDYVHGDAKKLLAKLKDEDVGVDFMFLDYFSSRERSAASVEKAIYRFLPFLKQNGIIAVHDAEEDCYNVKKAFKQLKKDSALEVLTLPYNYGLGLIRKCSKSKYGKITDEWQKKNPKG